jgi:hypothetical protein
MPFSIKPQEEIPQPDAKVVVEDPLNILTGEINAENEAKRKVMLTDVVQRENEAKKEIALPAKFESKWVKLVKEDQIAKQTREERERAERLAKYRNFLEKDSDDDEDANYDFEHGNMKDYLKKVS